MAAGDIWRVAIPHYNESVEPAPQCAVVIWYLEQLSADGSPFQLAEAIREAWDPFVTPMGRHVYVPGVEIRRVLPGPGASMKILTSTPWRGVGDPQLLPPNLAVEILRKSRLPGRTHWGRFYLPNVPAGWLDPDVPNRLTELAITNLSPVITSFAFTLGSNSTGTAWLPVVYSSRSAAGGLFATPIEAYTLVPHFRSMGRRGRRHSPCPPFQASVPARRVPTRSPDVLYDGDAATPVLDGGHWRGISSFQPNAAELLAGPVHWSDPAYDATVWHRTYFASTVFDNEINPCAGGPTWLWPPDAFGGSIPGFELPHLWGVGTRSVADAFDGDTISMHAGETMYIRRTWLLPAEHLDGAFVLANADDSYELWVNGELAGASPTGMQPAFTYRGPDLWDVTALLRPGALNCIGLSARFEGPDDDGHREAFCLPRHLVYPDSRAGWVAAELRAWTSPL